jgi:hypothetical protein
MPIDFDNSPITDFADLQIMIADLVPKNATQTQEEVSLANQNTKLTHQLAD